MSNYLEKFEKMRIAGKLAAQTLDMLTDNIKEGISTAYIDKLGYEFIRDNGGYSAPLYYRGFKKSLCTSLNHVVCHGIPSEERILEDGDAVNVDVTAIVNEHYGDTSRMFCLGKTSDPPYPKTVFISVSLSLILSASTGSVVNRKTCAPPLFDLQTISGKFICLIFCISFA